MTDQATRVVPAGWYEDPASSAHVRWWNGLSWTEHTAEKPQRIEPAVQRTVDTNTGSIDLGVHATVSQVRELEREYGIGHTEENRIIASAQAEALAQQKDAGGSEHARGLPENFTPRTSTLSAGLIALTPVFALALAAIGAYVYFYVAPNPLIALIGIVLLLLTILWALADSRKLRGLGLSPAGPAWALLGPLVYLIARRVRVPGSGALVAFLVLAALVIAAPVAAYATGLATPVTRALEIQNTVRTDLVGRGTVESVTCPPFADVTTAGTLYTCDARLANGASKLVWVSIDSNAGAFSYALALH